MQFSINVHVVNLLRQKGVCVLPGIGELTYMRKSASFSENQISGPQQEIVFTANAEIIHTALLDWIISEENINQATAELALDTWLKSLREEASSPDAFNLEGLGKLKCHNQHWEWISANFVKTPIQIHWEVTNKTETLTEAVEAPEKSSPNTEATDSDKEVDNEPETKTPEPIITSIKPDSGKPLEKEVEVKKEETISQVQEKQPDSPTEDIGQEVIEAPQEKTSSVMLWIIMLFLLVLLGGGYWFWSNQEEASFSDKQLQIAENRIGQADTILSSMATDTIGSAHDSLPNNTSTNKGETIGQNTGAGTYNVVVYQFSNRARAEKQAEKYIKNGNVSSVVMRPDSQYLVLIQAVTTQTDTLKIIDSIRCFFNPKGKLYLYK